MSEKSNKSESGAHPVHPVSGKSWKQPDQLEKPGELHSGVPIQVTPEQAPKPTKSER